MFRYNSLWRPGSRPLRFPFLFNKLRGEEPFVLEITKLLEDNFSVDVAAPLSSPRTCDVLGTVDILLPGSSRILGGRFDSSPVNNDRPRIYDTTPRQDVPGMAAAFLGQGSSSSFSHGFGWGLTSASDPNVRFLRNSISVPVDGAGNDYALTKIDELDPIDTPPGSIWMVTVREGGGFFTRFVRSVSGKWYILNITEFTSGAGTAMKAGYRDATTSAASYLERMIVSKLGNDFSTQFGWADGYLLSPVNGVQINGPPSGDGIIFFKMSTLPGVSNTLTVRFREVDENNYCEFFYTDGVAFGVRVVINGLVDWTVSTVSLPGTGSFCGYFVGNTLGIYYSINTTGIEGVRESSHQGVNSPVTVGLGGSSVLSLIVASDVLVLGNPHLSLEGLIA